MTNVKKELHELKKTLWHMQQTIDMMHDQIDRMVDEILDEEERRGAHTPLQKLKSMDISEYIKEMMK